jgi:high-affinity iron transporter
MFSAMLIVFRESLEAALFVGIVAAATGQLAGRGRWLSGGVALGALGSLILAMLAGRISAGFDGMGQDLVNVGVLTLALAMLLWHCIWVSTHSREMVAQARQLGSSVSQGMRQPWALLVAVALSVLREGAETVLFVTGSMGGTATTSSGMVVLSCLAGLGLGVLTGYLVYIGLKRVPVRHLFTVTNGLIALLAGSIASQLVRALNQAGFLDLWSNQLWDSSAWLSSESALGTLLQALVGYHPQPSGMQVAAYLGVLLLIYFSTRSLMKPGHQAHRAVSRSA